MKSLRKRTRLKLPSVSPREFAGILAALRVCQHSTGNDMFRGMEHWDEVGRPLTADQIDNLCEKLQFCEVER